MRPINLYRWTSKDLIRYAVFCPGPLEGKGDLKIWEHSAHQMYGTRSDIFGLTNITLEQAKKEAQRWHEANPLEPEDYHWPKERKCDVCNAVLFTVAPMEDGVKAYGMCLKRAVEESDGRLVCEECGTIYTPIKVGELDGGAPQLVYERVE